MNSSEANTKEGYFACFPVIPNNTYCLVNLKCAVSKLRDVTLLNDLKIKLITQNTHCTNDMSKLALGTTTDKIQTNEPVVPFEIFCPVNKNMNLFHYKNVSVK